MGNNGFHTRLHGPSHFLAGAFRIVLTFGIRVVMDPLPDICIEVIPLMRTLGGYRLTAIGVFLLIVDPQWQHVPAKPLGLYLRSGFGVLEQHGFVVESTMVCR